MEKTNREVISEFRVILKKSNKDAEALLSDRFILSKLKNIALLFIKQRTDKTALWNNPYLYQTIPCLQMVQVPIAECCNYQSGCVLVRSKYRLPKIAQGSDNKLLVQGIWSIDTVSRRFIEGDPNRYSNSLALDNHSTAIMYWIMDNYLYLGNDKIEKVKLTASFEEDIPEDLITYPSFCYTDKQLVGCCSASTQTTDIQNLELCCPPNPYNQEFPCPGYLIPDILRTLEKEFVEIYVKSPDVNKTTGIPKD